MFFFNLQVLDLWQNWRQFDVQTGPRHHPATAIIFVGSLLTLVFGVLNLIVAVDAWMNSCGCGVQQIGKGCDTDSNLWQSVRCWCSSHHSWGHSARMQVHLQDEVTSKLKGACFVLLDPLGTNLDASEKAWETFICLVFFWGQMLCPVSSRNRRSYNQSGLLPECVAKGSCSWVRIWGLSCVCRRWCCVRRRLQVRRRSLPSAWRRKINFYGGAAKSVFGSRRCCGVAFYVAGAILCWPCVVGDRSFWWQGQWIRHAVDALWYMSWGQRFFARPAQWIRDGWDCTQCFFRVRRRISFRVSVLRHLPVLSWFFCGMQSERVFGWCLKCLYVSCTVCFSFWWLHLSLGCVAAAILCDRFGHLCSHKTVPCTRTIVTAGRICICCGVYECAGDIFWGTRNRPPYRCYLGPLWCMPTPISWRWGSQSHGCRFSLTVQKPKEQTILFLPCKEKCEIIPDDSENFTGYYLRLSTKMAKGFCATLILLETHGVRMWSSFPRKIIFCRIKGPKRNLEVLIRHLEEGQTLTRMGAAVPPNL